MCRVIPAGYDRAAVLERLAQVLDPELTSRSLIWALCAH